MGQPDTGESFFRIRPFQVCEKIAAAGMDSYFFVVYFAHGFFPCVSAIHAE
jgi:hypothetical protein